MGYWKRIRKIETDQGLDIRAIRAIDNDLGTFKSTVLVSVPSTMISAIEAYTAAELQTFIEANCDVSAIEDGLAQTSYPSE